MKTKFIKVLCTALVCSVLLLSFLLVMAVYTGAFDDVLGALVGHKTNFSLGGAMGMNGMNGMGGNFTPDNINRPISFDDLQNMDLPDDLMMAAGAAAAAAGGGGSSGGNISGGLGDGGSALDDEVMLRITSAKEHGALYLKSASFGDFTGREWLAATPYTKTIGDNFYSAEHLPTYTTSEKSLANKSRLDIEPVYGKIYVNPYDMVSGVGYYIQYSDVTAMGIAEAGQIYTTYYYDYNRDYTREVPQNIVEYEQAYAEFVRQNYLNVDDETRAYMQAIIDSEGLSASDVNAVATYIQKAASYNLDYNKELDNEENIVIAFLDSYGEGVCRHYASAAALMYRTLGIPARYTVGYMVDGVEAEKTLEVKGKSAHAWVEIYVDGIGWQKIEVTGSSDDNGDDDEPRIKLTLTPKSISKSYSEVLQINSTEYWESVEKDKTEEYSLSIKEAKDYFEKRGLIIETVVKNERGTALTYPGEDKIIIANVDVYRYKTDGDGNIVTDENGNKIREKITDKCDIECKKGEAHLYWAVLNFISKSDSKVYDGEELILPNTHDNYSISDDDGQYLTNPKSYDIRHNEQYYTYEITRDANSTLTKVGTIDAKYSVIIRDNTGKNCTKQFKIDRKFGSLTVTQREIVFTPSGGTISKSELQELLDRGETYKGPALTYNGDALENEGALTWTPEGDDDGLLESRGHYIAAKDENGQPLDILSGELVSVPSFAAHLVNKGNIMILDKNGGDVTNNYHIVAETGIYLYTTD